MTYRAPAWQTILLTAIVALVVSSLLAFSRPAEMYVNGQRVEMEVPPVTTPDKVFVPLRAISEALGAHMQFDEASGRITVIYGTRTLHMKLGDKRATMNDESIELGHEPFRVRGHIMVGLASIERAFDVHAGYDARSARINIDTTP